MPATTTPTRPGPTTPATHGGATVRAAFLIAGKDLRQRLRDRSALMMALVLPLALAFIYDLVFGSAATPRRFEYAVVDLDGGRVAQVFVTDVLGEIERLGFATVRRTADPAQARQWAADGTVDAAFALPAGFSSAVTGGAPATIEVIGNVDATVGTAVARAIAGSYAAELDSARLAVAAVVAGGDPARIPPERLAAIAARAAGTARPVLLADVSAATRILDMQTYLAAGMAVFFLFFTVQFGVSSLLDERAEGTLGRLLAAPLTPAAVLAGKLLTSLVLGVTSMAVLAVATTLLMGATWGDPLGVALLIVAGVLAAIGVTALVAALARTTEQAGGWQAVIAVVLGLLGGAFFPIAQLGGVTAMLSLLTPHAWFLRGLAGLAGGAGPGSVLPAVGALLAFAAVTGGVAVLRLGRAVGPT